MSSLHQLSPATLELLNRKTGSLQPGTVMLTEKQRAALFALAQPVPRISKPATQLADDDPCYEDAPPSSGGGGGDTSTGGDNFGDGGDGDFGDGGGDGDAGGEINIGGEYYGV